LLELSRANSPLQQTPAHLRIAALRQIASESEALAAQECLRSPPVLIAVTPAYIWVLDTKLSVVKWLDMMIDLSGR